MSRSSPCRPRADALVLAELARIQAPVTARPWYGALVVLLGAP